VLEELRLAQPEDVDRLDNVPRVADRLLPRTTSLLLSLAPVILNFRVLIVLGPGFDAHHTGLKAPNAHGSSLGTGDTD